MRRYTTTALENRLERRLLDWRKLAEAYRLAQHECEPSERGWQLNKGIAETIDRLASEVRSDLSAARVISRSQYQPKMFDDPVRP